MVLIVGIFLSFVPKVRGGLFVVWDYDNGFSPNSVQITSGETLVWANLDGYGFDVRITFDNGLTFFLPNLNTEAVTFPSAGTYGFHSDYGDNGFVTVILPPPPAISLDAPRLEGNQFLFDATGLTVGKTNVLEGSTNLMSWISISTNVAADTSLTFTNVANLPCRFFRLIELP